jgi:hypothetical protein
MNPNRIAALLASIRGMHERIRAMSAAEAALLHPALAAEAAHLCECAGVTDSSVQRFAADSVGEAVRRRNPREARG